MCSFGNFEMMRQGLKLEHTLFLRKWTCMGRESGNQGVVKGLVYL